MKNRRTAGTGKSRKPRNGSEKLPLQVKEYVKQQLHRNLELKKADTFGAFPLAVSSIGTLTNVSQAQGREGECINLQHLRFSWNLRVANTLPVGTVAKCRLVIFEWRPLSVPTPKDVLEDTTASNIIQSPYFFTNRQFYKVKYDRVMMLAVNDDSHQNVVVDMPLKDRLQRYDDSIAPPLTMGILYYVLATDTPGVNACVFSYYTRVTFTDA